jgi:hypothetical protein
MPNLYFIKRALYKLKQNYGFPLDIYRVLRNDVNLATGRKTVLKTKFPVRRAILIQAPMLARKFSYDLTYLAANKNFAYGALYDVESTAFLIAVDDLPRGFVPTLDDYVIYNHKRYNVTEAELLDHKMAFFLKLKEAKGATVHEVHDVSVTSNIFIAQEASNAT